ncbi:hypothetical protein [Pseudomonas putida]|nr:hypothetical protein [Pseudomonas putida]
MTKHHVPVAGYLGKNPRGLKPIGQWMMAASLELLEKAQEEWLGISADH